MGGPDGRASQARLDLARARDLRTGAITSPVLGVVGAYILMRRSNSAKTDFIRRQFGGTLEVFSNTTGSMRSQIHVNGFVEEVLRNAVQRARRLPSCGPEQTCIMIEGNAPGHVGEKDGYLAHLGHPEVAG